MLSWQAAVNAKDSTGREPIHYVLIGISHSDHENYKNVINVIEILKSAGADLNAQTIRGVTAFHYAKRDFELHVLKKFSELGADIFKADHKGRDLEFRAIKRRLFRVLT